MGTSTWYWTPWGMANENGDPAPVAIYYIPAGDVQKAEADHAAEVERLTAEAYAIKCDRDGYMAALEKIAAERDAYRACLDGLEMREMDKMATEGPAMAAAIGSEMSRVIKSIMAERDALKGIVNDCMGILGMTQTAWDGTDIPRGESDLPRWVRDVADASYRKGKERDAAVARAERAEEALRRIAYDVDYGDGIPCRCVAITVQTLTGHAHTTPQQAAPSDRERALEGWAGRAFLMLCNCAKGIPLRGDAQILKDYAILAGHAPATPMLDQLEAPPQPIAAQAAPSDREWLVEALDIIEQEAGDANKSRNDPWVILARIENIASNALADTTTDEVQP